MNESHDSINVARFDVANGISMKYNYVVGQQNIS